MKNNEKMKNGWRIWKKRISAALACIVVFVTVYAMVLPAITLDRNAASQEEGLDLDTGNQDPEKDPSDKGTDEPDFYEEDREEYEEYADEAEDLTNWPVTLSWPYAEDEEDGTGFFVKASFDEDAGLPADASLYVEEIGKGTGEYEAYFQSALEAVRAEGVETEITHARFFDIAFLTAGGDKQEPDGPVSIVIGCADEKELTPEEGEELSIIRFESENPEEREIQERPVFMDTETEIEGGRVKAVTFDSDAFSVYGVLGTRKAAAEEEEVSFRRSTSFPGGGTILLSKLLERAWPDNEALRIGNAAGVSTGEAAEGSGLLEVSFDESAGDYWVTAHAGQGEDPGGRKEDLTLQFTDGSTAVLEITVTGKPYVDAGLARISRADGTCLPDSAEGSARELPAEEISEAAAEITKASGEGTVSRVFDISLNLSQEETDACEGGFLVSLTLPEEVTGRDFHLYQICDGETEELAIEKTGTAPDGAGLETVSGIQFAAGSFSEFVLQYTAPFQREADGQIRKNVISSSGSSYVVTAAYGDDAKIPDGAELRVREITEEEEAYLEARREISESLEDKRDKIPSQPVLLDISIWQGGTEIEPAEGSEVLVEVKFAGGAVRGMYSGEDSPVLVNDLPVRDDQAEIDRQLQVIHLSEGSPAQAMETGAAAADTELSASFTTDSFSNWLLYLDEDMAAVDVTTGDSITLRPYTEWIWKKSDEPTEPVDFRDGQWTFPASDWSSQQRTENGVRYTYYTHRTNGSVFRSFQKTDDQLNETYTVVTSVRLYAADGGFNLTTNKGKTIRVNVTQGGPSGKPDTVQGLSGLKVNLFDYDVPYQKNAFGQNIQGTFDFAHSGPLDAQSNVATNPNSNNNINTDKYLKFLGYGGSNTSQYSWYHYGGINNYSHADPNPGIVKEDLAPNGFPDLIPINNDTQNLSYLFDTTAKNHNVYAFPEADGLFQRDNLGYYYYNSNVNYAEYDRDSNKFILYEHTYSQNTGGSNGANAKPIGFFPFHEYDTVDSQPAMNFNTNLNHHFGMSMEVSFEIPENRRVPDDEGFMHDIIYEFSGDDDMWVFVDGKLALDIGGIHQPVTGTINFTTGEIKVHGGDDKEMNFGAGPHTLKMFYIERGGCDSNLSVRFNLPLIIGKGNMRIAKKSMAGDISNGDSYLPGAIFGIWENPECSGEPYSAAVSDRNGIVFKNLPVRGADQKFYLKEIIPPEGYLLDSTVYTLTPGPKDDGGDYTFRLSADGTLITGTDGTFGYPVIRNRLQQPVKVEVHKSWQNADGTAKDDLPEDLTAIFAVKRYRTYTTDPFLEINMISSSGGRLFDTISAFDGDLLTIRYRHAPDSQGTTADCTAGGSTVLVLPTNRTGDEISVSYTVNKDHAADGVINIVIPESFTRYCDGTEYHGENPVFGDIEPREHTTVREEDPGFEEEITLTAESLWRGSLDDLTVQEKKDGIVYHYEYFVTEKDVPEGFEPVFLDSDGNPIAGSAGLPSGSDALQEVVNRELLNVPVEKNWTDFSGSRYTWTAVFQLEEMEVKTDPEAPDAPDAVTDYHPVDGKVMTVSKGQTPAPEFTGLPLYRVHDNGTLYRILYSVEEIGYTVKRGGSIVAQWGKDQNGGILETIGDERYEPQFEQDAGELGSGTGDYVIKLANVLKDHRVSGEMDLSVHKVWPQGSGYAGDPGAYADFVLRRYVHQEYRDYTDTDNSTEWVTVTLDTWPADNSEDQSVTVPKGTEVHILGRILPRTNASHIAFSQSSGAVPVILTLNNSNSARSLPFDIAVTADQTKTITLTQGDNYVVGGREGFRLADYGDRTQDRPDNEFGEELPDGTYGEAFTLNAGNRWEAAFSFLPVVEEQKIDPASGAQTIYVYSYYIEETGCSPGDFYPVFRDSSGAAVGDAGSPVDYSTQLTAENKQKTLGITLRKVAQEHLDDSEEPPTLKGASFRIEKYTDKSFRAKDMEWGSGGAVFLSDDGEGGIFTFEGLPAGYYKIVETSVPEGYVKLSEDPVFEVRLKADGELEIVLLEGDGSDAQDNRTELLRVKDLTIRYGNYPGRPLPHTGGPGTRFFTVFGLALIAAALLLKRAAGAFQGFEFLKRQNR